LVFHNTDGDGYAKAWEGAGLANVLVTLFCCDSSLNRSDDSNGNLNRNSNKIHSLPQRTLT